MSEETAKAEAAAMSEETAKGSRPEELAAQGWTREFSAGPERALEMAELYRQLGREVQVLPGRPEGFGPDCPPGEEGSVLVVYTRRKP